MRGCLKHWECRSRKGYCFLKGWELEWLRVVEADPDFELWPGETDVSTPKGCEEVRPAFSH